MLAMFLYDPVEKKTVFAGKNYFAGTVFSTGKNVFFPCSGKNLPTSLSDHHND